MSGKAKPGAGQARSPVSELTQEISARLEQLTPRQRVLAEYLNNNPEDLAFCSVAQLAARAQVSEATVVRFCQALGYEGFTHLAHEAQQRLQGYLGTVGRFQMARQETGPDRNSAGQRAFERVLNDEIRNLSMLAKNINTHDFYACVESMKSADRICIAGSLTSRVLADFFGFILHKLSLPVEVFHYRDNQLASTIGQLTPKSLAFLIAFPRYPKQMVEIGRLFAESPAQVAAITNSHTSPVIPYADMSFLVPVSISSYADAYAAPITFISALGTELSEAMPNRTQDALSKYEDFARRAEIFAKPLTDPAGKG